MVSGTNYPALIMSEKKVVTLTPEMLVPRLGDYLVERNYITNTDLNKALTHQATIRETNSVPPLLGQILIDIGSIDRSTLDQAITELIIQLRSALQDANKQLEKRVQERTAELQDALQKLSELDRLKTNFVSNISHELRTPLTHLKGYLELLNGGDLGELNPDQSQAIQTMLHAGERLERLIEDLILFSMADRGQVKLHIQPIDILTICQTVFERSLQKAREKKINLTYEHPSKVPAVQADTEKISWAILQLLDNAIKFTPGDGRVELKIISDGIQIRVQVIDNGIGIPADKFEEIFEPFHQLDSSSTRRYGGTGLGLALLRKIIEAHGSKITVNSKIGEGSKFEFNLRTNTPIQVGN